MRDFLAELVFGGTCYLCRGSSRAILCHLCRAELPLLRGALCPRCALPSPDGAVCGRCLSQPPDYDATVAALAYDFPADVLVQALKFRGELSLAPLLASLVRAKIAPGDADLVVPVPLAAARLRRRGYNQAAELARQLPGRTDFSACVRERDATPQVELPWAERQRNVRGAFRCTRSLMQARVAVVDDVMTTGATLDEMARTLKAAGASRVVNWVVVRTLPPA